MREAATIRAWGPGTTIGGRFTIEAFAGEGGAGWVFRARDRDGSLVALKQARVSSEAHQHRFLREAEVLARLDHPAIVRHVDHGVEASGEPYLAMSWVEGETLRDRLAKGPLGVDEALTVGLRLADALACAHDAGLLHRDVKPANILLENGRLDRAVLVDFGLVRVETPDQMTLTHTGLVLGTPAYMAPEQAMGKRRDLDPRSDVFSLGCVLWECLTGVRAFDADNPLGIIHAILNKEPPPASTLNPSVPEHLDRFLARCVAKEAAHRPTDGAAVRAALGALQPSAEPDPAASTVAEHRGVLSGPPGLVWALLIDTNRWDRVAGAPATTYRHDDTSAPRVGSTHLFGVQVEWKEIGEWVEGQWGWGERRYSTGPFAAIDLRFDLTPHEQGTEVSFRSWATPAPGAPPEPAQMLAMHFRSRMAKYFDKLEGLLTANPDIRPLPGEAAVQTARRLLLRSQSGFLLGPIGDVMTELGERADELPATDAASALLHLLERGADSQIRQMRPRALAHDLAVSADELTDACFVATELGLVDLQLQLDCPTCRVAAQVLSKLESLGGHAHCHECHEDFTVALDANVEVVFQPNGAVREVSNEVWCAGSPVFRPHIHTFLRIGPRAEREVALDFPPGPLLLRVRGREPLRVEAPAAGLLVTIGAGAVGRIAATPLDGRVLRVVHEGDEHLELSVERAGTVDERLTLSDALAVPSLHRWVGSAPTKQLGRSHLTLWMGEVADLVALCEQHGDGVARQRVADARHAMREAVEAHRGAVLEDSAGGRFLACFSTAEDARSADAAARAASPAPLRSAMESGACMVEVGPRGVELFGLTVARCAAALSA